ncbi:MAG: hypothetical protein M3P39_05945 [Actinomycetota bacterium]|nr:hypothetical protein [Actinomycetota bacterium]
MSEESERTPRLEDAAGAADRSQGREQMTPGDEVPPGDPSAGENLCRVCAGTGSVEGEPCTNCGGTGRTTEIVSAGP